MSWVLLLEDEALQVKLVTDILNSCAGLTVKATSSKDEALQLANDNPSLIISDICLIKPKAGDSSQNRDGIIFSQAVKNNPATSNIPVILRSSMPLSDLEIKFADTKADIFLPKNTSIVDFIKAVKGYLGLSG